MGIVEKEGSLPLLDTANIIFWPTAEIITRLTGKIGADLPGVEGLKMRINTFLLELRIIT